jgi:hypothetical protein
METRLLAISGRMCDSERAVGDWRISLKSMKKASDCHRHTENLEPCCLLAVKALLHVHVTVDKHTPGNKNNP